MTIGAGKRIGLALSGGGFRAAAFHLGVFERLERFGRLGNVDLLSCVSGGSIAGAYLALHWTRRAAALGELEQYLTTKSIAVKSVLAGALNPFSSRLDELADSYDDDLFEGATLDALANGPRVYLNATNVRTGNLFAFVAGGGLPSEMGEHELGYGPAGHFSLARAVAASSAFPPVFSPMNMDARLGEKRVPMRVSLTDGGVYDNLGVNPLLLPRNDISYAIASDAGKPFEIAPHDTSSGALTVVESIGILMEQVRGLQFDRLQLRFKPHLGRHAAWFSVDSELQPGDTDAAFASAIGTNLKALSRPQIALLKRHSANLLEARLREFMRDLLPENPAPGAGRPV